MPKQRKSDVLHLQEQLSNLRLRQKLDPSKYPSVKREIEYDAILIAYVIRKANSRRMVTWRECWKEPVPVFLAVITFFLCIIAVALIFK